MSSNADSHNPSCKVVNQATVWGKPQRKCHIFCIVIGMSSPTKHHTLKSLLSCSNITWVIFSTAQKHTLCSNTSCWKGICKNTNCFSRIFNISCQQRVFSLSCSQVQCEVPFEKIWCRDNYWPQQTFHYDRKCVSIYP